MRAAPRLFVIVGGPASGKDEVVQGIENMGGRHADIVPKHTNRKRRKDDANELIFAGENGFNLEGCEITYQHNGNLYGVNVPDIWSGLQRGVSQVLVASAEDVLLKLRQSFGDLLVLIYVHSNISQSAFAEQSQSEDDQYIAIRAKNYDAAYRLYIANILEFDHVLIFSEEIEDLHDQIFRLFRAYETRPSIGRLKAI